MKYHHNVRCALTLALLLNISLIAPAMAEPNITKVTPDSGSIDGGKTIVVTGENFMGEKREQFIDIAAGVQHLVMLSSSHHVWTLGCNEYGQLGAGLLTTIRTKCQYKPVDITDKFNLASDDYIEKISSGDYSSFAISRSHRVFSWGKNKYGELGDGTQSDSNVPIDITKNFNISGDDYIYHIESGVDLSMAEAHSGKVFIWGDRRHRQDGRYDAPGANEQMGFYTKPTEAIWLVGDGDRSWGMSIGNHSAIMLTERDQIYTWGRNTSGELGRSKFGERNNVNDSMANYDILANLDLSEDDEPIDVEAGNGVMAVLTKLGRVLIWGNDEQGALGLNGEVPNANDKDTGKRLSSTPIDITNNFTLPDYEQNGKKYHDKIAQISIGNSHVLALSQYGRVFGWGADGYGQLGDGQSLGNRGDIKDITDNFQLVNADATIEKVIAAGAADGNVASYSFALDSDGNVYAWGGSATGNSGINAIAGLQNVPSRVSDRLTAKVPLVAEVDVDDVPAKMSVTSDKKLHFTLPEGNELGRVDISLIDNDGNEIRFEKAFTYTENKSESDDISDGGVNDADKSKSETKSDSMATDWANEANNKLTSKALATSNKDSDSSSSSKTSGASKSSSSSTKSSGSTGARSSSSRIAAPNTGAH